MKKTIGIGIIGSGSIARTHVDALAGLVGARLVAIAGRNHGTARALAETVGAQTEDSVEALVRRPDVDAVMVATPSGAHLDPVLAAIRAGKHVLCEKPLEIDTGRALSMVSLAREVGVLLGGFFPMRFGAGARAMKRALDGGRFGRLVSLGARVKWWRDAAYYRDSSWRGTWALDGGGALMNQGIHAVDLLQWFGGKPAMASAFAGTLAHPGIEVEDTLSAVLKWGYGAIGAVTASTACHPGLDLSIEVSGDAGTAVLANGRIEFWRFSVEQPGDDSVRAGGGGEGKGGTSDPKAISCAGHREQIRILCESIRAGAPQPGFVDGAEACKAVSIVEAIYKSARSLKAEPISQDP
jgi:predicted dehydrogenase